MTKIICGDLSCKHNNDINACTLKNVYLSWSSIVTLHEGRQEVLKCRQYEESNIAKRMREYFESGERFDNCIRPKKEEADD